MRVLILLAVASLAGCLSDGPVPAPVAEEPAVGWIDVRAAPEGFAGSEVSMAVDPNDPLHVVASAHAGGFGVYESFDGGRTWQAERLTANGLLLADPQPGLAQIALSDPVVAFSPDGTLHIAGLAYIPTSSVFVATRTDGVWSASTVWQSEVGATMNDKEWLTVSPAGTLVAAWQSEPAMDQLRGVEQIIDGQTGQRLDIDVGHILVSRSSDGGATWSLPALASTGLHNNGTQVAFDADGTGYLSWVDYELPGIVLSTSHDDGATWSATEQVADLAIVGSYANFGRMHTLPGMAVDNGTVYITWHDARHGDADILLAIGHDGDWTTHRVPVGEPGDGNVQLYPWVAADAGRAWVTYYSASNGTRDFTYLGSLWDGAFHAPEPVANATFQVFADAVQGPADIGDYTATAARGGHFYAAWADPRSGDSFIHVAHRDTLKS